MLSTRIDEDLLKSLKHLAVEEDESLGNLIEEAIRDLLSKYDKAKPTRKP